MYDDDEFTLDESRNSMQKAALIAIYDALTYRDMGLEVDVRGIVSALFDDQPYEECDYFVKACLVMAMKHFNEIVEAYNKLMRGWTFDRRNRVEQAILLLAYAHFYYVEPEVEKGVVIDIAVKQAKAYLDMKDYKFVNAILDNALTHAE